MKNAWQNQHRVNLLHNARKNMKIGFLKHRSRVIASLIFNKPLEMSTLICHESIAVVRLLGSCFLPLRLSGASRGFLRKILPELLKDVDLQTVGFI